MSILLRVCSSINLILALVTIIVQAVILAKYSTEDDPAFSKTGVGIWAGIVLLATGICLWLSAVRYSESWKIDLASLVLCILSIIVSIAMIALSCTVINEITEFLSYDIVFDFVEEFHIRRVLERILLACAVVALIIDIASIIFLRIRTVGTSSTISQQA